MLFRSGLGAAHRDQPDAAVPGRRFGDIGGSDIPASTRAVLDRGRRTTFRRLLFGVSLDSVDVLKTPDAAEPADEAMVVRQETAALDQAVSHLPANLKTALLLTAFEGLSQHEASEVLGVSVKAIETRTRRARQILARTLDPTLRSNS